jgi:hypothetical protein
MGILIPHGIAFAEDVGIPRPGKVRSNDHSPA